MSQARALYQLQSLELRQREVERRLQEIAAALANDEAIAQAKAKLQQVQGRLQQQSIRQREGEDALSANEAKSRATDERLYSGRVSNPKEMAEMQQELAALQRRRGLLEEHLLEVMDAVERSQADLNEAQENLRAAEAAQAANHAEWRQKRDALSAERRQLMADCSAAVAGIADASLAHYRRLAKQKRGRAVSLIAEGRCAACGVSLSTGREQRVKHGKELLTCQSCGRLLVAETTN
ncbi:MAG: C4-type zinc ribbon domain-containing protein [Anaerolineaceae bacterium]|nr:C4-type zinc ribbon domain-containing protein [Anaerolineaceae bacterium]